MSIGAGAIGELAIGGQPAAVASSSTKTPRKRRITAKADVVQTPEAR
jgi:hypothetical protein